MDRRVRRRRRLTPIEHILRTLIAVTATLLVLGCAGVAYAWWRYGQVKRVTVKIAKAEKHAPQNFLLVGSDSREGIDKSDPGAGALLTNHTEDGKRSDTLILLRVDQDKRRVDMVSFPRDLWLTLPNGHKQRINAAYQHGAQNVIDTVQQNFNVPVNHYIEVNLLAFQKLVEAVGGVPIFINKPIRDTNSGLYLPTPGCVRLDPYQALAFSRSRHLYYKVGDKWHYDPTGDAGRITRQQVFMRQALNRVSELGLTDAFALNRLAGAATDTVTLDSSLSISDLLSLGKRFRGFTPDKIQTHTLVTNDWTTDGGAKVQLLDKEQAEPIFRIFRGEPDPPKAATPVVIPEQLIIDVMNGSGTVGQGRTAANSLNGYGYVIGTVGNPTDGVHSVTEVHHPPGARASADLVVKYIEASGAVKVVEDPAVLPGHIEFLIGSDYTGLKSPKERAAEAKADAKVENEQAAESGATTTTVKPTEDVTGPVGLGVEVGAPPPGVKCD